MNNRIFIDNCRSEFSFLKNPIDTSQLLASHIAIKNGGYLIPLSYIHLDNDELIVTLWKWREANAHAYPSRFQTTKESTKNWIKNAVLDNPDRILFLIYDETNALIGHAGFADVSNKFCQLEFDNILRGEITARKGIMSDVMKTLKRWAEITLFPNSFYLKVLGSNAKAVEFYKNLGYFEAERYPLKKELKSNGYALVTNENINDKIEDHFIIMKPGIDKLIGEKIILTAGPSIGTREKVFSLDAASNGWNSQWNKYLTKFENEFASYIGVKYAIATSSCTGALHIALMSLGLKEGDEVIVPDVTWVSTANAVMLTGATPVFADIEMNSWNISVDSVRGLINEKTKAIIPVHLYGNPCEMDEIIAIAKEFNLYVIEDAAPSVGAEYKGKRTGSFGDFSAFSFQGAKLAVTGEGGMLCTNNEELYKKAYRIWDQGRIPGTFWIEELGLKYKMSNIQAALGIGQLHRNDAMVEAKRRINCWYKERLGKIDSLDFWEENEHSKNIFWMTCIRLNDKTSITRENFCTALKEKNIDSRPVFPAISQYPYWPKKQKPQPISSLISETGINLPSGVGLLKEDIMYICDVIENILIKDI